MIIAIDPATREMGVAVFTQKGKLVTAFTCRSALDSWGARIYHLRYQLSEELEVRGVDEADVRDFAVEIVQNVPLRAVSANCLDMFDQAKFTPTHCISPSSWKSWAKKNGCTMAKPKGEKAVEQCFGKGASKGLDENACDAILIGMAFMQKRLDSEDKVNKRRSRRV